MRYIYYQPNTGRGAARVGDCAVRAICKATGQSWGETYAGLCATGSLLQDMPNSQRVIRKYLRGKGYRYHKAQQEQTLWELTGETEGKVIALCKVKRGQYHLVTVSGRHYYDTWRSGKAKVIGVWSTFWSTRGHSREE